METLKTLMNLFTLVGLVLLGYQLFWILLWAMVQAFLKVTGGLRGGVIHGVYLAWGFGLAAALIACGEQIQSVFSGPLWPLRALSAVLLAVYAASDRAGDLTIAAQKGDPQYQAIIRDQRWFFVVVLGYGLAVLAFPPSWAKLNGIGRAVAHAWELLGNSGWGWLLGIAGTLFLLLMVFRLWHFLKQGTQGQKPFPEWLR